MKSVFIVQTFFRSPESQLAELYSAYGNPEPDEIWILGRENDPVPADTGAEICLLAAPDAGQESWLEILCARAAESPAELYMLPSDNEGRMLAARFAYRLGGAALSSVLSCSMCPGGKVLAEKLCYNGHMKGKFEISKFPVCLSAAPSSGKISVRMTAARPQQIYRYDCGSSGEAPVSVEKLACPDGLSGAEKVVAVGLGVKNSGRVSKCRELASRLGAAFAASRPVVMNGWAPEQALLGVSGSVISPEKCLTLGVSGSGAFMVGIKDSGKIIAVNTDPHAPIFKNSDLGAEADCMEIVDEMLEILNDKAGKAT